MKMRCQPAPPPHWRREGVVPPLLFLRRVVTPRARRELVLLILNLYLVPLLYALLLLPSPDATSAAWMQWPWKSLMANPMMNCSSASGSSLPLVVAGRTVQASGRAMRLLLA